MLITFICLDCSPRRVVLLACLLDNYIVVGFHATGHRCGQPCPVCSMSLHIVISQKVQLISHGASPGATERVCLLFAYCPSNRLVYLRNGSAQFYLLPHWDRSCRSNYLPHPVTVYWHWADQYQRCPYNARSLAGKPLECQFLSHRYDLTQKILSQVGFKPRIVHSRSGRLNH